MAYDRRITQQGTPSRGRSSWRQPRYGAYKRGLNSKIHLAVDANGMPIRVFVTAGTVADCTFALPLIRGMTIEMLLADRGYDTNEIIDYCRENDIEAVIPPKKNRIVQREYDEYIYKLRHLVENAFLKLKQWRGVATRYAKSTSVFLGAVTVRCLFLWLKLIS